MSGATWASIGVYLTPIGKYFHDEYKHNSQFSMAAISDPISMPGFWAAVLCTYAVDTKLQTSTKFLLPEVSTNFVWQLHVEQAKSNLSSTHESSGRVNVVL